MNPEVTLAFAPTPRPFDLSTPFDRLRDQSQGPADSGTRERVRACPELAPGERARERLRETGCNIMRSPVAR